MITVDREVCINCGACVAVCPAAILGMGDEGPEAIKKCGCIKCGHCVAVCPVAALDHEKAPAVRFGITKKKKHQKKRLRSFWIWLGWLQLVGIAKVRILW